jgi:hypothetical protein
MPQPARYTPGRELVARKAFRFDGRLYAPGAAFDPEGVPARRVRQMFDSRMLRHSGEADVALVAARRITLEGKEFAQGEVIDPAIAATLQPRRVRQLIDQHWLKEVAAAPAAKPVKHATVKREKRAS